MNTFKKFLETKMVNEVGPPGAPPAPAGGGIGAPGALPPAGGAPPIGGAPPMGGAMGGAPPMGGMPGAPAGGQAPNKLKAYNVWDVLERVLSGDGQEKGGPKPAQ